MKKLFSVFLAFLLVVFFVSCATMPKGASIITDIEKVRYLGKWYEIARFDFAFEKDLKNTTAEYAILPDGTISVLNKGYNYKTLKWTEAKGVAKFRSSSTVGALEVSFFGPFFAAYNIIALDKDYKYALVAGATTDYLWFLSREKEMPQDIKDNYVAIATSLGYDLTRLVWVEHDK